MDTTAAKLQAIQDYAYSVGHAINKTALIQFEVREYQSVEDYSNRMYIVYHRGIKLFIFTKCVVGIYRTLTILPPEYVTEVSGLLSKVYDGFTFRGITHHSSLGWVYTEYGIRVYGLTEYEKSILQDVEALVSL